MWLWRNTVALSTSIKAIDESACLDKVLKVICLKKIAVSKVQNPMFPWKFG